MRECSAIVAYRVRGIVVALLVLALGSVQLDAQQGRQGPRPPAFGEEYMVASGHPLVTEAVIEILEGGGNAVDAMITALFLEPVVEPNLSTIAGGMGGLIYMADTDELVYLDGMVDLTRERLEGDAITSGNRIGVPGTVRGLEAAAERYGTQAWEEYLAPAIRVAEEGFPVFAYLYSSIMGARERISAHAEARETFLPDGVPPNVGEILRQPRLAETLRTLSREGADYVYTGEWAERFVGKVNETGGRITLEELEEYEARWMDPIEFTYRGHRVVTPPPPSTAGIRIAMILNILESFDLEALGHYTESAKTLVLMQRAFDQALLHAERFVADPLSVEVPVEKLLSKEYAGHLAGLIDGSRPRMTLPSDDPSPRSPSSAVGASNRPGMPADFNTNHLVIVDPMGNWVSMVHSVYGTTFGTGLSVGGVGVNSGNGFRGARIGEGRRTVNPGAGTMVLNEAGRPWVALGSPGLTDRAVAMTLINLLGFGMDLHSAIDTPRFRGYAHGSTIRAESRFDEAVLEQLQAWGLSYSLVAGYDVGLGSMKGVMWDEELGRLIGVADARRTGDARGR